MDCRYVLTEALKITKDLRATIKQEGFGIYSNKEVRDILKDVDRHIKRINY